MPQADNVAELQQLMCAAHLRHADKPWANGFDNAFRLWRKHYEAKAAIRDQNPTFAAKLLPATAPIPGKVPGLPLVPTGIRKAVDEFKPGTVSVSVDIAGSVVITVQPPNNAASFVAPPTVGATRQSTVFPAVADGIYKLSITANGSALATVYVLVHRKRMLAFRQLSRYLAFDFRADRNPPAYDTYSELLALIYAMEAAVEIGQLDLYTRLAAIADALNQAPHPIAVFPRG